MANINEIHPSIVQNLLAKDKQFVEEALNQIKCLHEYFAKEMEHKLQVIHDTKIQPDTMNIEQYIDFFNKFVDKVGDMYFSSKENIIQIIETRMFKYCTWITECPQHFGFDGNEKEQIIQCFRDQAVQTTKDNRSDITLSKIKITK